MEITYEYLESLMDEETKKFDRAMEARRISEATRDDVGMEIADGELQKVNDRMELIVDLQKYLKREN